MNNKESFIAVLNDVNKFYQRVFWEDKKVLELYGKRNLQNILNSHELYYLCCLERHLLVAYLASQRGIPITLVMLSIHRRWQIVKIGAAIEFEDNGSKYSYIGALSGDKIIDKTYPYKPHHKNVYKINISDIEIDLNQSWIDIFIQFYKKQLHELLPEFNIEKYIKKRVLKKNSHTEYEKKMKKIKKQPLIETIS